jgi:hypothetical protein
MGCGTNPIARRGKVFGLALKTDNPFKNSPMDFPLAEILITKLS